MVLRATCMILVAGALAACGSSATSYSARGVGTAVGADATVTIAEKENQNYELDLKVEHLLPPDRAAQGAQSYAVWIQPEGQESPFHIGNLDYNDSSRVGALTTITPHRSFEVFVTAEPTATPMEPQGPEIVNERVQESP